MSVQLESIQLPKAKGGRKATPLDSELLESLANALKTNPKDGDRPAAYGPSTEYETEGKAGGPARKYAAELSKALKKKVKVRTHPTVAPKDGKPATGPFKWKVYIPLNSTQETNES